MSHDESIMHKCYICGKCFTTKRHFTFHIITVHKELKNYQCEICEMFFSRVNYIRHMRGVHEEVRDFICRFCEKAFTQAGTLRNHIKLVHKKSKPYTCDFCGMISWTKHTLNNHISNVHKEKQSGKNLFSCNFCPKKFKLQDSLQKHSGVHQNVDKYTCGLCRVLFSNKGNLNLHYKTVHEKKI